MTRNWTVRAPARWLAMIAILALLTGAMATSVLAAPSFTFTSDDRGANDEPGQKDLTAQASAYDGTTFYSAWKWDDTSWSGNNTGDGCSLFDTAPKDGNVDYAVCATIGGKTPALILFAGRARGGCHASTLVDAPPSARSLSASRLSGIAG